MAKQRRRKKRNLKRTEAQKAKDYQEIDSLLRSGKTWREIGQHFSQLYGEYVPHETLWSQYFKTTRRIESSVRDKLVEESLSRLLYLQAELLDAWEESKKEQTRTKVVKRAGSKASGEDLQPHTVEAQKQSKYGDVSILRELRQVDESIRKLLGVDAPDRTRIVDEEGKDRDVGVVVINAPAPELEEFRNLINKKGDEGSKNT